MLGNTEKARYSFTMVADALSHFHGQSAVLHSAAPCGRLRNLLVSIVWHLHANEYRILAKVPTMYYEQNLDL